ncbi:MAG: DUF2232 domain-containing protein [Prochloraceae cyanobacterium]|nr:DUF2232 domain-containing protein [Prochloraceae cyanobacterium]
MPSYENPRSGKKSNQENNPLDEDRNWVDEAEPQYNIDLKAKKKPLIGLQESTLILVETAFLSSTASLIWLINSYLTIAPVLRMFFPIPTALIYLRWGNRAAWMSVLTTGLLLTVLVGPTRSILYVIPYGLMGVQLGFMWKRQSDWLYSITLGTIINAFGLFFSIQILSIMLGEDVWIYLIGRFTDLAEWMFMRLGLLAVPSITVIEAIAVGMILLNSLIYSFAVHAVALLLMDKLGSPIPRPPYWVQILLGYE